MSPGDAAQMIFTDSIHILINLNGYTKGSKNEIFALHPAPLQVGSNSTIAHTSIFVNDCPAYVLQVAFLGYCGTMGADYIEYMIADRTVIPNDFRRFYTEKIISMPHSYFVNDHKNSSRDVLDAVDMPTRSKYGISDVRRIHPSVALIVPHQFPFIGCFRLLQLQSTVQDRPLHIWHVDEYLEASA